jgi:hypothetical protein
MQNAEFRIQNSEFRIQNEEMNASQFFIPHSAFCIHL